MRIIYVYQNCFILENRSSSIIFDVPDKNFIPYNSMSFLKNYIEETSNELFFITSHSHIDHFNSELFKFSDPSKRSRFIFSEDCCKKLEVAKSTFICAKEGHSIETDKLKIQTIKSNDEGLAYLIELDDKLIFFGGDLACWNWNDLNEEEYSLYVEYYHETIKTLSKQNIDIAFTNSDLRLKNYSGVFEFANVVRPKLLVPMHLFGKTEKLSAIKNEILDTPLFIYNKTGDKIEV